MGGKRFYSGHALVGFAVPSEGEASRVGVTVSRSVKSPSSETGPAAGSASWRAKRSWRVIRR